MSPRRIGLVIVIALGPLALMQACSGEGGGTVSAAAAGPSSGHGGGGAGATSGTGGDDILTTGQGGGCATSDQCSGGVCLNGSCCDSLEHVCGNACCTAGTECLFDQCVIPGDPCHTAHDCDPGQYCETALGGGEGGGGGQSGQGGGACTSPLPLDGRCLDLPPLCGEGGGSPDAGCLEACEYHPPSGLLDTVVEWQWGPVASHKPNATDVWSTPTVGRIYDGNCDGKVDELDSPNIVFVSVNSTDTTTGKGTCCQCTGAAVSACLKGVLRMLDGRTGQEVWSVDKASDASSGFAGVSTAIGDLDGDGRMDIAAVTGEGYVVILDGNGNVLRTSDKVIPNHGDAAFGWGGGLSIADMDGDGYPEIAYGSAVFTTKDAALTRSWTGTGGIGGGGVQEALSTFVDLDGAADGHLELLAGRTAYKSDGTALWNRADLTDGFPAAGDLEPDGKPDVVLVANGKLWVLDGATGVTVLGPKSLPGTGSGGPPTIADFDGDGHAEIGVAMGTDYSVLKPNYAQTTIDVLWQIENHDLSSSVTGSSVFDFEGDGRAEVIYGDECFLWVYDGQTGAVRYATPHTSFTATEASLVADVDGDGHAEIVMVSNGADPSASGWKCDVAPWNQPDPAMNRPAWAPPAGQTAYRGIAVLGDKTNSWVGTRTLWTEHTYHVTNVCDDRDSACSAPNVYGSIPAVEKANWTLPWLNNFRQNVQDTGIFDAPDATVSLEVECVEPLLMHASVRNIGLASLAAGVNVGLYVKGAGGADNLLAQTATTHVLFPGQTEELDVTLDSGAAMPTDTFLAKILTDPLAPTFHECRDDNNESAPVVPKCVK